MKLAGVMINSEQPAVVAAFYTKFLGEPGWQEGEWFGYDAGASLMVGPHSEVKGKNTTPGRIMVSFNSDTVEADFARLKEYGGEVIAEPYHPTGDETMWLATIADPDGNYIQLSSPWKE